LTFFSNKKNTKIPYLFLEKQIIQDTAGQAQVEVTTNSNEREEYMSAVVEQMPVVLPEPCDENQQPPSPPVPKKRGRPGRPAGVPKEKKQTKPLTVRKPYYSLEEPAAVRAARGTARGHSRDSSACLRA
jgi:hypothetical protein